MAGAGRANDVGSPSTFPAVIGGAIGCGGEACQTGGRTVAGVTMIDRSEIVWLGVSSAVSGCLIGGMMLGIGLDLIVNGQPLGWLIMLPGAPVSAIPGWLLARRLARQL
jgi:hypothetical protein